MLVLTQMFAVTRRINTFKITHRRVAVKRTAVSSTRRTLLYLEICSGWAPYYSSRNYVSSVNIGTCFNGLKQKKTPKKYTILCRYTKLS